MILTGEEIRAQQGFGLRIEPFNEAQINPNSYNLRLADELMVYTEAELDAAKPNPTETIKIPPEGFVLEPSRIYLGRTVEHTQTFNFVPMLEGRSSVGRLGILVHISAGFGDVGFRGYWTLELHSVQPVRIYAGMEICQIYYHTVKGAVRPYRSGKYQNNTGIQPSLLYRELQREEGGVNAAATRP